jgi:hypothetical protein
MNQGQEQFFHFILERVQEGKQEEAKGLLEEGFEKQEEGTFNAVYMESFIPRMLDMLKPEYMEEVKGIMTQFKG